MASCNSADYSKKLSDERALSAALAASLSLAEQASKTKTAAGHAAAGADSVQGGAAPANDRAAGSLQGRKVVTVDQLELPAMLIDIPRGQIGDQIQHEVPSRVNVNELFVQVFLAVLLQQEVSMVDRKIFDLVRMQVQKVDLSSIKFTIRSHNDIWAMHLKVATIFTDIIDSYFPALRSITLNNVMQYNDVCTVAIVECSGCIPKGLQINRTCQIKTAPMGNRPKAVTIDMASRTVWDYSTLR